MWVNLKFPLGWKLITLIGFAVILLVTGAYLYYLTERGRIFREKVDDLEAIAKLKISEITHWHEERLSEAEFFPGEKTFINNTKQLLLNKSPVRTKRYFDETLTPIKINHHYENIFIADSYGKLRYSLDSSLTVLDAELMSDIQKSVFEKKIIFTDFYYCTTHKKIHYDIVSPIFTNNNLPIAVMILRVNPYDYLYPLIQSWPVPSKTAETLIIRKEGKHIIFLNELKYLKNTALKLELPLIQSNMIEVKAALGIKGIVEGKDYRNIDVLGDIQQVPGTSWYLISKQDKTEVYAESGDIATLILFITILSILLIGTGLTLIYKYRQGNIFKEMLQKEIDLAETQEEFRTTIYSIGEGVITTNTKGRIMRMNPVAERLTGWKENEAQGKNLEKVFNIVNEETGKSVENSVRKILSTKTVVSLANHVILISKTGKEIPMADSGAPIINDDGKTIGVVFVFKDQTAEREAEKKLRESEEKNRALLSAIPDLIFLISKEGVFLDYRSSEQEKLLLTPEQFLGKQIYDVLPPDIAIMTQEKLNKLFEKREPQVCEYQLPSEEEIKNYECRLVMSGEDKALAIVRDVTESKKAGEKVRRLSRGVEQSPATIMITDINGNIEYVNPKFTEITGYTFDEVRGLNPRVLKSGDKSPEEYEELWNTILGKKEWRGEFQNKKKNGELYWEFASISPIFNEKGQITNFIAVKEDITDRKKMMNELIEAKQKAEEMNRIKTYFYANMSHELRTPFVGIMGFAELLAETLENPEEREMAEAILKASKRLTDTLNKILNVTDIEFGKLEIQLKGVDILTMVESLQVFYSKAAEHQHTKIETEFKCDPFLLKTDAKLLEEILNNLINNAVKFTFDGVIKITVEIEDKKDRDYLKVSVSDTGVGIPKDKQEVIWQEFRQVSEGYGRSSEGTGLGLSIVKKYTELLNGQISVESEPGKGSVFILELPMNVEMEDDKKETLEVVNEEKEKPEIAGREYKILLVEDDVISVDLFKKILSNRYRVDVARDAIEAFKMIKENSYTVLLIDINLGTGMNGIELTQKIREIPQYKSTPIIAVTAYATTYDRNEFLSKGFSYYISKPFALKDLKEVLKDVLN